MNFDYYNLVISKLKAYFNIVKWILYNCSHRITYPTMAHLFLTYRCNLKCKNCKIWKLEQKELNTEEIKNIVSKLHFLDIVKITGGEPLLREDIVEIVDYIKRKINPYILRITTNGAFTERIKKLIKVVGYPNLQLRISLDSWGKEHNEIRGEENTFKKVLSTLDMLIRLRKVYDFKLGINFGIRNDNLDIARKVKNFCKKRKIEFIPGVPVKPFIFEKNVSQNVDQSANRVLERGREELMEQYCGECYNFLEKSVLKKLGKKSLLRGYKKVEFSNFNCQELRSLMYILPDGDLVKCGLNKNKLFDLVTSEFDKIWFSSKIDKYRDEVDKCDGCLQSSIEILSRIYSGKII